VSSIGIVGGGVIGAAAAAWLIADGHEVTVFEAEPGAWHASSGNAGILAVPEIEPLATIETLMTAPGWLIDPEGPLSLRWRDIFALMPWLTRFALSARPERTRRATLALASLMRTALADHEAMAGLVGGGRGFRHTGGLTIFDSDRGLEKAWHGLADARELLGSSFVRLTPDEVRERVPALRGPFAGAIGMSDYHIVDDPRTFLEVLRSHVSRNGAFLHARVDDVRPAPGGIQVVTRDGSRTFDRVVLAGGVWARDLVRRLGLSVTLETERGYNTTWTDAPIDLPLPLTFADHGFVATPLSGKLRVGGAVELAGVDAPARMSRARALRDRFRRYAPELPETGGIEWMGRRPSTPDSVPVISHHPDDARIMMAFGHGHLGLTLSAVTGRLIADMTKGRSIDHAPALDITRFS